MLIVWYSLPRLPIDHISAHMNEFATPFHAHAFKQVVQMMPTHQVYRLRACQCTFS
jgi:hypothetical protein